MNTLTKQEQFFYDNTGTSWNPATKTQEEGKLRGTRELAAAETWAVQNGYTFACEHDNDADESWMKDEPAEYREKWAGHAWWTAMYDAEGTLVQSLGASYGDDKYKRVVRAELALEEMLSTRQRRHATGKR